jgi:hypothetical protein
MSAPLLTPKPGFDWSRVRWDAGDAPQRDDCSYCGAAIPEEAVPLRMWRPRGDGCVFCDACAERWWGMKHFGDFEEES